MTEPTAPRPHWKASLKRRAPWLASAWRHLRWLPLHLRSQQQVFRSIYRSNAWGSAESVSGPGSTVDETQRLRGEIAALLRELGLRSVIDAPCGDFNWFRHVDLAGIDYLGLDIVPELVARNQTAFAARGRRFAVADITADPLPRAGLLLCRDCFVHLSFRDLRAALRNFARSDIDWFLFTHYSAIDDNEAIPTGAWRALNLCLPPIGLPAPQRLIVEDSLLDYEREQGKSLALWRRSDLELAFAGG